MRLCRRRAVAPELEAALEQIQREVMADALAEFNRRVAELKTPAEIELEAIHARRAREDAEWAAEREAR